MELPNFDYCTYKLWPFQVNYNGIILLNIIIKLFQDLVYAIEFIKALPVYQLMHADSKVCCFCSKEAVIILVFQKKIKCLKNQRTLLASSLLCADFTAAFYSYSHNSVRTFYPDGSVMTWSKEM